MIAIERRKIIINLLKKYKVISIKSILQELNDKENNIRNDIRFLKELGLVTQTYGSVRLTNDFIDIDKYFFDFIENESRKRLISEKAFELIKEDDSIILGPGTTVFELARIISKSNLRLNVITLSLPVLCILAKKTNINLMFIGGKLIRENFSFEGIMVEEMLNIFSANLGFIGIRGFSMDHGFTIPTMEQVITTRAIAKATNEVVVLTDSSKFSKNCFIRISSFQDEILKRKITKVITNKDLEKKYIQKLRNENIDVILV